MKRQRRQNPAGLAACWPISCVRRCAAGLVTWNRILCAQRCQYIGGYQPRLVLEEFFAGRSAVYGIFEDRFGNLRRQFRVNLSGTLMATGWCLMKNFYIMMVNVPAVHGQSTGWSRLAMAR